MISNFICIDLCGRTPGNLSAHSTTEIPFHNEKDEPQEWLVAPTVAELGKELPIRVASFCRDKDYHLWCCLNDVDGWLENKLTETVREDTEANARAKMWLYLKREGLL